MRNVFLIYILNHKKNRAHLLPEGLSIDNHIIKRGLMRFSPLYLHAFSSLTTWYCITTRIYVHIDNFFLLSFNVKLREESERAREREKWCLCILFFNNKPRERKNVMFLSFPFSSVFFSKIIFQTFFLDMFTYKAFEDYGLLVYIHGSSTPFY